MLRPVPLAFAACLFALPASAQDWRANCLTARGQDKVVSCTKALEAEPKDLMLRRILARAYLDVGDGMGGTGEYGAIAQDHPDDPRAWFDYATALATDYRYAESAVAADHALKLKPAHFEANKVAVIAYERVGRFEDAYAANLRLAGMGDAIGMYDVAESLVEGRGVKSDPPSAVPWYRRAAEAGHFGAMAMLAKIYREGLYGQAKNAALAADWAKKAE